MKLIYAPTSPYARKVRILIHERGLEDAFELVRTNPLEPDAAQNIPNPLGKVPTLVLQDGSVLFDSPVICAYIDQIGTAPPLAPGAADTRWRIAKAQALGDGVIDAAFSIVMEKRRPNAERSAYWLARWRAAIERTLPAISADIAPGKAGFDLGHITYACALGYLDFRLPELAWRSQHSALAAWYEVIAARPGVALTVPA